MTSPRTRRLLGLESAALVTTPRFSSPFITVEALPYSDFSTESFGADVSKIKDQFMKWLREIIAKITELLKSLFNRRKANKQKVTALLQNIRNDAPPSKPKPTQATKIQDPVPEAAVVKDVEISAPQSSVGRKDGSRTDVITLNKGIVFATSYTDSVSNTLSVTEADKKIDELQKNVSAFLKILEGGILDQLDATVHAANPSERFAQLYKEKMQSLWGSYVLTDAEGIVFENTAFAWREVQITTNSNGMMTSSIVISDELPDAIGAVKVKTLTMAEAKSLLERTNAVVDKAEATLQQGLDFIRLLEKRARNLETRTLAEESKMAGRLVMHVSSAVNYLGYCMDQTVPAILNMAEHSRLAWFGYDPEF